MGLTFQLILLETYNTPITLLEDHFATIPAHWKHDQELTRAYGSQWLLKKHSPILRVPSVHSPWEYNYLLNPDHPQLDVEIVDTSYYIYDARFIPKPYYRRLFAKDCGMVITTNHACDRTFRGFNDGFETASLLSTFP